MNNGEYEFDKYLKEMEAEATNLKTAHQRPLGALNFFKESLGFAVNLTESYGVYAVDFYVTVTIATPTTKPPIVQTGWSVPAGFIRVYFIDLNVSSDYTTWQYQLQLLTDQVVSSAPMNITTLSSQPIIDISWGYV